MMLSFREWLPQENAKKKKKKKSQKIRGQPCSEGRAKTKTARGTNQAARAHGKNPQQQRREDAARLLTGKVVVE